MIELFLKRLIYGSKIAKFFKIFLRSHCAILAYHRVCPLDNTNALLDDLIVEPHIFEKQIKYIKENYKVVSLNQLVSSLIGKKEFCKDSIVLTFDDACEDIYTHVFPILKKYNLPATIFIPTSFVGNNRIFWWERLAFILRNTAESSVQFEYRNRKCTFKLLNHQNKLFAFRAISVIFKCLLEAEEDNLLNYLSDLLKVKEKPPSSRIISWEQMKEMARQNITFGAHTHTHRNLSILDKQQINDELTLPKKLLGQYLKTDTMDFAYPFGEKSDFDLGSINTVSRLGYRSALTMIQGFVFPDDNHFMLRRIGIGNYDTDKILELKLAGLMPWHSNLRGLIK